MATKKTAKKKVAKAKKDPVAGSMSHDIFSSQGKKKGSFELPESIFALPWNASLIHQVVTAMEANARQPLAHVKTRGEVRGGGKKPWKQKGTGRARHGSIRSPIWIGGGVTHGPRNDKVYSKKINKKMRGKALAIALSQKVRDGQVLLVDEMAFTAPKAKEAKSILSNLSKLEGFANINHQRNAILIALPQGDTVLTKSFRNFGNVKIMEVSQLNPVEVLRYKHVAIVSPEETIHKLAERLTTK